jgi:hypothetical protein
MAAWACAWLLVALPVVAQETNPSEVPWEKIEAWVAGSEAPDPVTPQPSAPVKEAPADVAKDAPKDIVKDTPKAEIPAKAEHPAKAEAPAKIAGVSPEIDHALRTAGWTSIAGNWKQIERNVYEVTDGRLEAQKANGRLNVSIRRGSTGRVAIYVRCPKDRALEHVAADSAPGYGFVVKGLTYGLYAPILSEEVSGRFSPFRDRGRTVVDAPRHTYTIDALTNAKGFTRLTHYVDDKRERSSEYRITTEGVFTILVLGTAILESPQATQAIGP